MPSAAERRVRRKNLDGTRHYRIIPSRYPPVGLFDTLVEPDELEVLFELEGMTNDRLRDEAGEIALVPVADRLIGPACSSDDANATIPQREQLP